MNELSTVTTQLPENINDLARFALVGREKLAAVRAEINAIKKVGLAKEVLEQKRLEAQEIAELVTLSEVKIGKMLKEIPKASGGDRRSEDFKNRTSAEFEKPKAEVIAEIGIKPDTAQRFQTMADHEVEVHEAIKEARENNDIVSRSDVFRKIASKKINEVKSEKTKPLRDAKVRHVEFQEKKSDGTVSFSDVKQDREDRKAISCDFVSRTNKAMVEILNLGILSKSSDDLRDICKSIDGFDLQHFNNNLSLSIRALSRLRVATGG